MEILTSTEIIVILLWNNVFLNLPSLVYFRWDPLSLSLKRIHIFQDKIKNRFKVLITIVNNIFLVESVFYKNVTKYKFQ